MRTACVEWPGTLNANGYGTLGRALAHRLQFQKFWGVGLPKGIHVLHICDNPACINPDHLFIGTQAVNMQDMVEKGRQSRMPNAKLNEWEAVGIMARYLQGGTSQRGIASEFGVSQRAISKMLNGKIYAWLFSKNGEV